MNTVSVLEHLVKVAHQTLRLSDCAHSVGLPDDPYFSIYGDVADAIYNLIGETDDFEDSATYRILHNDRYSDEICVRLLMKAHEKNKMLRNKEQMPDVYKLKFSARPKIFPPTRYSEAKRGCGICGQELPPGEMIRCPACGSGILAI